MSPRERIIAALKREVPDRVPKHAGFTDGAREIFKKITGAKSLEDYFGMEVRWLSFEMQGHMVKAKDKAGFAKYFNKVSQQPDLIDKWGVGYRYGSMPNYKEFIHPVKNFTSSKVS